MMSDGGMDSEFTFYLIFAKGVGIVVGRLSTLPHLAWYLWCPPHVDYCLILLLLLHLTINPWPSFPSPLTKIMCTSDSIIKFYTLRSYILKFRVAMTINVYQVRRT